MHAILGFFIVSSVGVGSLLLGIAGDFRRAARLVAEREELNLARPAPFAPEALRIKR